MSGIDHAAFATKHRSDGAARRPCQVMTPERFQQVKAIVTEASEENSRSKRAELIALRCGGDLTLVREVEVLMAETTGTIESFAAGAAGALRSVSTRLPGGWRIGAYAIIRELGRGGMGTVYLAERADQEFNKQVAIKLLKRGTDTDEVLRRFRAEREILARLQHPNIAYLIDGGTTDDGLPYFVMEYVAGSPVTDFCTAKAMGLEPRLRLFLKICGAVQFAHQNLVVHRDIKPANILITPDGEPKLLDFGIAKLLASDEGGVSLTLADQRRLTPAYASPEQVRGDPITTVSDVYALGALLYEVVTGKNAHHFSSLPPSPTELLRVVSDEVPVRPSAAAADPATARHLRGDIDNILLQALRKEPGRRYAGVNAFAEDVGRYLDRFPVRARKDTVGYRASKFIERNRLGVAAASLVLLALLGGLGATAWEAHVAHTERAKAVESFNQVRELAHSVLFDYHDAIAALPGSTAVRQRLVQDALKYLNNVSKQAGRNPSLLRELADAYDKVAAVQGSGAAATGGTLISASNLGDTQGALTSYNKALALRQTIWQLDRSNKADLQALARTYSKIAAIFLFSGPPDKTVEYEGKAIAIVEGLLASYPVGEEVLYLASSTYKGMSRALGNPGVPNLGDTKGSLEYMHKALLVDEKLVAGHPDNLAYQQGLGNDHNSLGLLFSATGDRKEQLDEYMKAVAIDQSLVAAQPDNTLYRRELAVQLGNVGSTLVQMKDLAGALKYSRQALAIYEALAAADPSDVSLRRNLAVGYRNVGVALGTTDHASALENFGKAKELLADLVLKDPKNDDFRKQWAIVYLATSRFQGEIDDPEGAAASALEGITITEALVAASPKNAGAQNTLAQFYSQLGASHVKWALKAETSKELQTEHWRRAKEAFGKSLGLYQDMKSKGTLSAADASKPDELASEIARCNAALL